MNCKNCGYIIQNDNTICPFCNNDPTCNIINNSFNDLFKERKIDVKFNVQNILNDVDINNEYQNIEIKEANIDQQYLDIDLSDKNKQRILEINNFYLNSITIYKKQQKKNLEIMTTNMLQAHVASFNNIVNNCNKFKKLVRNDVNVVKSLNKTINLYNKEIHYIKKYFILPLYDMENLINKSKIAKNCCMLISLMFFFFVLCSTPLFNAFNNFIELFAKQWNPDILDINRTLNLKCLISFISSIFMSDVLFALYIKLTIKNKNFEVDKGKRKDGFIAIALVGFVLSCLHPILSIVYNLLYFIYLLYLSIYTFFVKKWDIITIFIKLSYVFLSSILILFSNIIINNTIISMIFELIKHIINTVFS